MFPKVTQLIKNQFKSPDVKGGQCDPKVEVIDEVNDGKLSTNSYESLDSSLDEVVDIGNLNESSIIELSARQQASTLKFYHTWG